MLREFAADLDGATPTCKPMAFSLTVRALIQKPLRSGQGPWVSVGFRGFWSCSFGFRRVFVPPGPILESAFLWPWFCRQNTPCTGCLHMPVTLGIERFRLAYNPVHIVLSLAPHWVCNI